MEGINIFGVLVAPGGMANPPAARVIICSKKGGRKPKNPEKEGGEGQGRGGIFALHKVVWNYASTGPATRHLILLLSDPKSAH